MSEVHLTQTYPVHCCCEPGKRLGYLPGPRGANQVTFLLLANSWDEPMETVTLRLRKLHFGIDTFIMAFDSNHQDLETLRRIPGWRDSKPVCWPGSASNQPEGNGNGHKGKD